VAQSLLTVALRCCELRLGKFGLPRRWGTSIIRRRHKATASEGRDAEHYSVRNSDL
jgi:hypothetical protein